MRILLLLLLALPLAAAEPLERLGSARFRFPSSAGDLAVSPDGRYVVVDGIFNYYCFNGETGELITTFDARNSSNSHTLRVLDSGEIVSIEDGDRPSLARYWIREPKRQHRLNFERSKGNSNEAISPDGRILVCNKLGEVLVFDTLTGKELRRLILSVPKRARGLAEFAFSGDSRRLAVKMSDGDKDFLFVFDRATGAEVFRREFKNTVDAIALGADGDTLAYSESEQVHLIEIASGKSLFRVKSEYSIDTLAITRDRGLCIADHVANKLLRFDAAGKLAGSVAFEMNPDEVRFSSDGSRLVLTTVAGAIVVYDTATCALLPQSAELSECVTELRYTPAGRLIGFADGYLTWEHGRTRRLGPKTMNHSSVNPATERLLPPQAISLDGERLAEFVDGKVRLSSTATGSTLWTSKARLGTHAKRDDRHTPLLAFSGDELLSDLGQPSVLAAITREGSARQRTRLADLPAKELTRRTASPDGRWLATILRDSDDEYVTDLLYVHDTSSGKLLFKRPVPLLLDGVVFSDDSSRLLVTSRSSYGIIDSARDMLVLSLPQGRLLAKLSVETFGNEFAVSQISRDGRMIATEINGNIAVLETATGKIRCELDGYKGWMTTSLAFPPGQRALAVGTSFGTVELWDIATPIAATAPAGDLFSQLSSDDAAVAYAAILALEVRPASTVALLREKIAVATALDAAFVKERIAKLDAPAYRDREAATAELAEVADRAVEELRSALAASASAEARERLEGLLERAAATTPQKLLAIRAVETLERINDAAAWTLIAEWSKGLDCATLTREAREALSRKK